MGIISTIKSLLGVDDQDRNRPTGTGTPVSVERETSTESETAVKGVGSTPSADESTSATVRSGAGAAADREPEPATAGGGESVDTIKGIGAAYAERLADAGVHTVEDLAEADADALAAETDLGAGRVSSWIEQARAR